MAIGDIFSGVGNLIGAAGDIASIFRKPEKQRFDPAGLIHAPFTGLQTTPAFSFGGGTLTRRNDDFLQGQRRLRGLLGGLQEEVRPGFGRLTETGVNAIRQKAAQAAGNLRSQLARRGLAGASFAEDQLSRVGQEYQQAENEFRTQAFQQELAASMEITDREQASLLSQATQELQELNVASNFLQSVNQAAIGQKEIDAALKEEELMNKYFGQQTPATAAPAAAAPVTQQIRNPPQRRLQRTKNNTFRFSPGRESGR